MKIRVESYAGHKLNQRPIKFWIGERLFFVDSIEDEWYGVDAKYFRVRADDQLSYVLGYAEATDIWTLEKSRA